MEGDLHFSSWEASLEEKETRKDGHLHALNKLPLYVSSSPRDAFCSPVHIHGRGGTQCGGGMICAGRELIQLDNHAGSVPCP